MLEHCDNISQYLKHMSLCLDEMICTMLSFLFRWASLRSEMLWSLMQQNFLFRRIEFIISLPSSFFKNKDVYFRLGVHLETQKMTSVSHFSDFPVFDYSRKMKSIKKPILAENIFWDLYLEVIFQIPLLGSTLSLSLHSPSGVKWVGRPTIYPITIWIGLS